MCFVLFYILLLIWARASCNIHTWLMVGGKVKITIIPLFLYMQSLAMCLNYLCALNTRVNMRDLLFDAVLLCVLTNRIWHLYLDLILNFFQFFFFFFFFSSEKPFVRCWMCSFNCIWIRCGKKCMCRAKCVQCEYIVSLDVCPIHMRYEPEIQSTFFMNWKSLCSRLIWNLNKHT